MELVYIYHSGFALCGDDFTVIMDYYRDSGDSQAQSDLNRLMDGNFNNQGTGTLDGIVHDELLHRPGKLYVLVSHFHPDHFNKEILTWREQRPDTVFVFSKDILRHRRAQKEDAIWLEKGEVYQDETLWVRAFGSTDVGVSFLFQVGGKKIFHAGDLNNWHWMDESDETEWRRAEESFLHELDDLFVYAPKVDVAMFPVDPRLGKKYMRGAEQFVAKIKTHIFVPMHFTPEYAKANAFRDFAEVNGVRFIALTCNGQKIKIEQ
ncbi:MAG: MBL fold metallo-hydrolase [Phocaeicola sp.]|nr:MBL fold metallo-hydrolase [Phocaeicola sp.]